MIKNLVFSGAGTKIYSFIGALKVLEEKDLLKNIENIIGTSSGSIMGIFVCLGFKVKEIEDILIHIDTESLKDIDSNSIFNFFTDYGIDDGKNIRRIMNIILKAKLKKDSITFKEFYELNKINFTICATNLNKNEPTFFNHKNTPNMCITEAIMMSICIPLLFKPIFYEGHYYVDGGLTNNYPINYFKNNKDTLGILINNSFDDLEINNLEDYLTSILFCSNCKLIKDSYKQYKKNTIFIQNNFNFMNFSLSKEKKNEFIDIGYKTANLFFENKNKKTTVIDK